MENQTKGKIFRIAGVSGVGKTTLTTLLEKLSQETSVPCQRVDTKKIVCKLAGVPNEKQYRMLPEEKRRDFFPLLMKRIIEMADTHSTRVWFFERHLCSMSKGGAVIERGVPDEHGERMVGLALVVAREQQISAWRKLDEELRKDRHILPPKHIAQEQLKEIDLAFEGSKRWNFPLRLFFNEIGQDIRVAREILSFLKEVSL